MSDSMDKLAKGIRNAIDEKNDRKPKAYDTQAEVLSKDGDILWVHIPGGVDRTPVRRTVDANEGDSVMVRVADGRAWTLGNATNPPTDDSYARRGLRDLKKATQGAVDFVGELSDQDVTVNSIRAATGYIDDLYSKNIHTDNIWAATGYIDELTAKKITTDNIDAATGYIGDLTSKHITVEDIEADHETVGSLDATYAKIDELDAAKGRIDDLEANEVVVHDTLKATNAEVEYLSSDWISTDRLVLTGNNKNNYPPVQITEAEFNVNKTAYWTKDGDNYIQCTEQSVYNKDTQYYVRQSVRAIIEAINNANRYTAASPTQAEFNADKTSYYTYDGSEYIQCKSTDTYNPSTQYYIYDTEILVSKDKLIAASIDVAELSAITANMGELTAGLIKKGNNFINLNTSPATMEFKNRDSWESSSEGIQFDAQGRLKIKGAIEVTSGSNVPTTTEMNAAIDDISVGGRNLLKKSEVSLSTLSGNTNGGTTTKVISEGSQITVSVMIDADNVTWDTTTSYQRIGCEMSVLKSGGGYQYVGVWAGKEIWDPANIVAEFTGSFHGRVSKTFTLLGDISIDKACYLYIQGVNSGSVTVSNIKLEVGNKATDWTPSPEDVQAEIDAKKSMRTLVSSYSTGFTYSSLITYAAEGRTNADWDVTDASGVQIGDVVRISCLLRDISGTHAHVVGEVTNISGNRLYMTMRGIDSTVISGGNILANSITADKLNANSINASNSLTVGAFANGSLHGGGKNLLSGTLLMLNDSGDYKTWTFRSSVGALSSKAYPSSQMPVPNLYRALKCTNNGSSVQRCGFAQDNVPVNILSGTYVTMSAWIRASAANLEITFQPFWYNNALPYTEVTPKSKTSTTWQYVTQTFKTTTNISPSCSAGYIYVGNIPANGWFEVTGLKVEVGSLATEYTDDTEFDGINLSGSGSDLGYSLSGVANTGFLIGTAYGCKCAYANGEKGVAKMISSKRAIMIRPKEIFTISCDMYLNNYSAGTTNPYVTLYFGGSADNPSGTWAGAEVLLTTVDGVQTHLTNEGDTFSKNSLNGKGKWSHVVTVGRYDNVSFNSAFAPAWIYARDFTGQLGVKNFKLERGYKDTGWNDGSAQDTLDNAAKTATNYLYADSSGLRIASASPSSQNQRMHLTSSQLSMYSSDNVERLRLNSGTGVLVGRPDKGHTVVNDNGLDVYASDGSTVSGYFHGDTARIGRGDRGRVDIASTGIDMYGYNSSASTPNQNLCHIGFASGAASSGTAIAPYYTFGTRSGNIGNYSTVEGYSCVASGYASHAEGYGTKATGGGGAHAEGNIIYIGSTSSGNAHITTASGIASHAEGSGTTASGDDAHSEGWVTTASGSYSHAEGYTTTASGIAAHAEGFGTTASGNYSHASGGNTIAAGNDQTAIGKYNVSDTSSLFIVGNGTSAARSTIFKIDSSNITIKNGAGIRLNDGAGSVYSWNSIWSSTYADTSNLYIQADGYIGFYVGNTSTAPTGRMYVNYEGTTISGYLTTGSYITSGGVITSGSNIRLKNNVSLQGANTSGAWKSLIYISGSNTVNLGNSDGATYVNGTSFSGSKSYTGSDLRLKHDIVPLDDRSSELIMSLKPFEYKWNEGQKHFYSKGKCFGLGAQEVSKLMDDIGYDPKEYRVVEETPDGYLAICYTELIPHLIYVAQKQQKEIEELKGVIKCIS